MDTQGKTPAARCSTVSLAPRSPELRFPVRLRPSVGGALLIMECAPCSVTCVTERSSRGAEHASSAAVS
jgi:hypothetical protein